MRRINDPFVLREVLSRLSPTPPRPAQARLLLARRGLRAGGKALEEALQMIQAGPPTPVRKKPEQPRQPRLKPLDDLPLTPKEREIMERLRREREVW
jgi:hypothetical protein